MVNLVNIKKEFDKKVLDNINLKFNDNGLYVILGESGVGKSTILNIISLLEQPSSGEVFFKGINLTDLTANEKDEFRLNNISFVFQEFGLIEYMTVYENILIGLSDNNKVNYVLEELGILDLKDMYVNSLSGGERQRVAICRALLKNSSIILADEPTGSLDENNGELIMKYLKDLSNDRLVIVVTHNNDFAYKYGDEVYKLDNGNLINVKQTAIHNVSSISNEKEKLETRVNKKIFNRFLSYEWKYNKFKINFKFLLVISALILLLSVFSTFAFNRLEKVYVENLINQGVYNIILDDYNESSVPGYRLGYVDLSEKYSDSVSSIVFADEYEYDLVDGRFPTNSNEVIISDYLAEAISIKTNLTSLLDYKISYYVDKLYNFNIVGVYKTNYLSYINNYDELNVRQVFNAYKPYYCTIVSYNDGKNDLINGIDYFSSQFLLNNNSYMGNFITNVDKDKILYSSDNYVSNAINVYITLSFLAKKNLISSEDVLKNIEVYYNKMIKEYKFMDTANQVVHKLNVIGVYDDSDRLENSNFFASNELQLLNPDKLNFISLYNKDVLSVLNKDDLKKIYNSDYLNNIFNVIKYINISSNILFIILLFIFSFINVLYINNYYETNIRSFVIYNFLGLSKSKIKKFFTIRSLILNSVSFVIVSILYYLMQLINYVNIETDIHIYLFVKNKYFIFIIFCLFIINMLINILVIRSKNKLINYKNI